MRRSAFSTGLIAFVGLAACNPRVELGRLLDAGAAEVVDGGAAAGDGGVGDLPDGGVTLHGGHNVIAVTFQHQAIEVARGLVAIHDQYISARFRFHGSPASKRRTICAPFSVRVQGNSSVSSGHSLTLRDARKSVQHRHKTC